MQRTSGRRYLVAMIALLVVFGISAMYHTSAGLAKQGSIDEMVAGMSLEQKVGQMVMAGIPNYDVSPEAVAMISKSYVGGIMLAARNIRDTRQSADLTSRLQALAAKSGAGVPLLIAADQEGGYVVRLRGEHLFPGNMALGATGSPALVQRVAQAMGTELRAAGINMNFAPVLDVNSNPDNPVIGVRSFGENPVLVAQMGSAYIAGMHAAGVLTTAKHFPGHGDTAQDSHIALPTVAHPRSRLDKVELYPFNQAIKDGVDAIMTAHVTFPAIEPTPAMPATLSPKVLTGLLRNELGFAGLVVTDSMGMAAITQKYGMAEAAIMAVQAGADIVLTASGWNDVDDIVAAILAAVRNGAISESRIDASVRRILAVKERIGLWENGGKAQPLTAAEQQEVAAASAEAAARSVTLVRDVHNRLPLNKDAGKVLVVMASTGSITGAEDAAAPRGPLAQELRKYVPAVSEINCTNKPDAKTRSKIVTQAKSYDTVVMATYYAWSSSYAGQAALVDELSAIGKEPIVVSMREPYDLRKFPYVGTYLAAYSANPESMAAVAQVLAGKQQATGRLPVSIPGLAQAGW